MKKRFITTAAMAAITATMLLNGCGSSQTASTSAPQTETQAPSTEAKPDETEETTAAPETGGSETEALAEDVVRTEAVYVKDSEFAEDGWSSTMIPTEILSAISATSLFYRKN